jgi:hypothetical protein
MRISTSIQTVAALTGSARHVAGTYGPFSLLELSITSTKGDTVNYDLFLPDGPHAAQSAEIYARHINAAALEVAALTAVPVETVVEGEAA